MLDTSELRVFVHVGSSLSFAAAARALSMTPSAASKAVARLESQLSAKLLLRTTRSVRLTDAGQIFLERAARILDELAAAERGAQSAGNSVRGSLRLDLPLVFGARRVVPLLAAFRDLYPDVRLDVRLDDRYIDLAAEGVDAAVRVGSLDDSRLIARKLTTSRVVTVASPEFLKKRGRPGAPEELKGEDCLLFRSSNSGRTLSWQFARSGRRVAFTPAGVHSFSNSEGLLAAVISGLGVAQVLDFAAAEALHGKKLLPLFSELAAPGPPISLVCLPEHSSLPKVRALSDFLVTAFATGRARSER
jgi:LysR family transcriptional regulator for bpeEF and oprC